MVPPSIQGAKPIGESVIGEGKAPGTETRNSSPIWADGVPRSMRAGEPAARRRTASWTGRKKRSWIGPDGVS